MVVLVFVFVLCCHLIVSVTVCVSVVNVFLLLQQGRTALPIVKRLKIIINQSITGHIIRISVVLHLGFVEWVLASRGSRK